MIQQQEYYVPVEVGFEGNLKFYRGEAPKEEHVWLAAVLVNGENSGSLMRPLNPDYSRLQNSSTLLMTKIITFMLSIMRSVNTQRFGMN